MQEQWKPIKGYEGLYEVSNLGRVKRLEGKCKTKGGNLRTVPEKILKFNSDKQGYKIVDLCKDGTEKYFKVHRLVAFAFIPNPENKPYINHIDCNPSNNCVTNLEWCTPKENIQYAQQLGRLNGHGVKNNKNSRPVIAIKDGVETYYASQAEVKRQLGISNCYMVCQGKYKQIKGYTFKYVEDPN